MTHPSGLPGRGGRVAIRIPQGRTGGIVLLRPLDIPGGDARRNEPVVAREIASSSREPDLHAVVEIQPPLLRVRRVSGLRDEEGAPQSGVTPVVPAPQQRMQPGFGRGISGKPRRRRAGHRERNPQVIAEHLTHLGQHTRPARQDDRVVDDLNPVTLLEDAVPVPAQVPENRPAICQLPDRERDRAVVP